jgi:Tol biopolymer transport system component
MELNPLAASNEPAMTASAPASPASGLPTLPPTWTPSPSPLAPTATSVVATPTSSANRGLIFFIFNGDSIAWLAPDGSAEDLLRVGGTPADLSAAPDGSLLAYTAQGNGSAREVFVTSPDGTYNQQVSCLGFARVLKPTWSFDSQTLAFAASQTPEGSLGIYTANVNNSAECPVGNNQRQVAQLEDNRVYSIAWTPAADWLFFSHGVISAVNLKDGTFHADLIPSSGYGPNLSLAHNPITDSLVYLKAERDNRSGQVGGTVYTVNMANFDGQLQEYRGAQLLARSLEWSKDGRFLLVGTERDVWVQDEQTGSSRAITQKGNFDPQPAISPDGEWVAYVDGGRDKLTVPQVFVMTRNGENPTPISFHQEGTITDLVWTGK